MLLPQSVWRRYTVLIFTMLLLGIWPPAAQAQINVSLTPSLPSGQAVGTTITWKAATAGSAALAYLYYPGSGESSWR
jgi:hypothetical protein